MIIPQTTYDLFVWASDIDTHVVGGFIETPDGLQISYRDKQGLEIEVHFSHSNAVTFIVRNYIESAA